MSGRLGWAADSATAIVNASPATAAAVNPSSHPLMRRTWRDQVGRARTGGGGELAGDVAGGGGGGGVGGEGGPGSTADERRATPVQQCCKCRKISFAFCNARQTGQQIGRAHVGTPVTRSTRMPYS